MLHDLREIPVIDPFATLLALYEMLGLVFRGNAESGSKISREVTHGAIVPWASAGDASLVRRIKATRQARVPPVCGSARPSSLPAQLGLGLPHLLRLISNFLFAGDASPVLLSGGIARRSNPWAGCRPGLNALSVAQVHAPASSTMRPTAWPSAVTS